VIFLNSQFYIVIVALVFSSIANLSLAASKPDFASLQQQAIWSNATYFTEDKIRQLSLSRGYQLSAYKTLTNIQISYFLLTNDVSKTQIIAIRGTSNVENAMVNINLKLVFDQVTQIYFHHGFSYAARQVYRELKPLLKKNYRIQATGHSLGGAVAVILAAFLDSDGFDVSQVVTFGQPKLTNLAGADKLKKLNITRVVTPKDLVPLVPLFDPLDINNIDIFWHAGTEIVLLKGNQYAVLEGINSMLRATRFTQQLLTEENLKHHQMALYLRLLKGKVKSSEEVPFENDFNLFNLFGSE